MLCPLCDHEVPPAPPLRDDFEFDAQYNEARAEWTQGKVGRTKEWGYCECGRCEKCWDILHVTKPCHCGKTLLPPAASESAPEPEPPPAPPDPAAGASDGLPLDPS